MSRDCRHISESVQSRPSRSCRRKFSRGTGAAACKEIVRGKEH
jgi:hypothetical protein